MTDTVRAVRERLQSAQRVTLLTGAGVSAASGVPTFRGAGGLWRNHQAQQLATPEAFTRDPQLVWEWYAWRRQVISLCSPNPAHAAIARWSERPGFTLVTQNVDGLHARPGVVWFGESISPAAARAADEATRCDIFLSIGTSAVVYPAAGLIAAAKAHGAFTVEINPETTSAVVDIAVAAPAEDVIPTLV